MFQPAKFVRRTAIALLTSAVLSSGLAAMTVQPAKAATYPGNCTKKKLSDGRAYALCTTGTVSYRVGFSCRYVVGYPFEVNGNWTKPGNQIPSIASCPWGAWSDTQYPWINV